MVEEQTGVTPEPLLKRPEPLSPTEQDTLNHYHLLAASRPIGMGAISGITTTDILNLARSAGFREAWFLRVIRQLDGVFLEHVQTQMEETQPKKR